MEKHGASLRLSKTKGLRPATEANRERLFSSIQNKMEDQRVLDLFFGTGSYGLEAISRGAKAAGFVEKNHRVVGDLKRKSPKGYPQCPTRIKCGQGTQERCLWNF